MSQEEAEAAWKALSKPVTKAGFVSWYMSKFPAVPQSGFTAVAESGSPLKKRRAAAPLEEETTLPLVEHAASPAVVAAVPAKKRRATVPAAEEAAVPLEERAGAPTAEVTAPRPPSAPEMSSSQKALLKGLAKALHAATKAKARWHKGDFETISEGLVMSPDDFTSLMRGAGVALTTTSPILTTFSLSKAQLTALLGADKMRCAVRMWSHGGGFRKTYQTGRADVVYEGAEGKFSRATSTVTLKVESSCTLGDDRDSEQDHSVFAYMKAISPGLFW